MLAPPVLVSRLCTLCTLYCGAVLGGTPPLYGEEVLVASPRSPRRRPRSGSEPVLDSALGTLCTRHSELRHALRPRKFRDRKLRGRMGAAGYG